jgi:ABC-type amino acid transport system permease subunit
MGSTASSHPNPVGFARVRLYGQCDRFLDHRSVYIGDPMNSAQVEYVLTLVGFLVGIALLVVLVMGTYSKRHWLRRFSWSVIATLAATIIIGMVLFNYFALGA